MEESWRRAPTFSLALQAVGVPLARAGQGFPEGADGDVLHYQGGAHQEQQGLPGALHPFGPAYILSSTAQTERREKERKGARERDRERKIERKGSKDFHRVMIFCMPIYLQQRWIQYACMFQYWEFF